MEYEVLYHASGSNVTPKTVKHSNSSNQVLAMKNFFAVLFNFWTIILKVNVFSYMQIQCMRTKSNDLMLLSATLETLDDLCLLPSFLTIAIYLI